MFASRVLSKTETMYATTKTGALAVEQAVNWFKSYIWSVKFVVRTDNSSLRWLFCQNSDGMTFRMLQALQEFDFEVVHRPGNKHGNADGLSRQPTEEPTWKEGEQESATGTCPEAKTIDDALAEIRKHHDQVQIIHTDIDSGAPVIWTRPEVDTGELQRKDPALNWVMETCNAQPGESKESLGPNPVSKEHAVSQGEEIAMLWATWDQLLINNGVLYRRWSPSASQGETKQLLVPVEQLKEILDQLHASPTRVKRQ